VLEPFDFAEKPLAFATLQKSQSLILRHLGWGSRRTMSNAEGEFQAAEKLVQAASMAAASARSENERPGM
jgi:hypothetical protein